MVHYLNIKIKIANNNIVIEMLLITIILLSKYFTKDQSNYITLADNKRC